MLVATNTRNLLDFFFNNHDFINKDFKQGTMSHGTSMSIVRHLSDVFKCKIIIESCIFYVLYAYNWNAFYVDCAFWKINSGILIGKDKGLQCVMLENRVNDRSHSCFTDHRALLLLQLVIEVSVLGITLFLGKNMNCSKLFK